MNEKIAVLKKWIEESSNIVFFGGAGVSTESGIPDFRSVDGLYNQKYDYPPEMILSHSFFEMYPEVFYKFYRDKLLVSGAEPNTAHKKLARLEKEGKLRAVITQNIDGLHQKAGSEKVLELHGTLLKNYCVRCGKKYSLEFMEASQGVPRCACGGIVRPDVVLYEEGLSARVLNDSIDYIRRADVLIVGGTSLAVYPAAGLVKYYRGDKLVLINRGATSYDAAANLLISEKIGEVFSQIG